VTSDITNQKYVNHSVDAAKVIRRQYAGAARTIPDSKWSEVPQDSTHPQKLPK
jgi:hypothetical protein